MSKPTFSFFCVHTGYFRNDRTLALREKIGDRAFHIMPMLWSWASENQMDGDMSDLSDKRFQEILNGCNLKLTLVEARKIKTAVHEVGFVQKGLLHSWDKFNRHCVDYEKRRAIKQTAAFERWKHKVEGQPHEQPHRSNGQDSSSKQLWMIEQALKSAKGKARKALLIQREELLSEHTGVDLSEPQPAATPSPAKPPKQMSPARWSKMVLQSARQLLKDNGEDAPLTEAMVTELHKAGDTLPERVCARFKKVLADLEKENPVPE